VSTPVLVQHTGGCPRKGFGHTDDAKRASDHVNIHLLAQGREAAHHFVALGLADGSSDGVLYDSYEAAVSHQHGNEQRYFYIKVPPTGMPVCDAESLLYFWRMAARKGFRTDVGVQPIPRLTIEDQARQIRALR
jgi:hypothetical protein